MELALMTKDDLINGISEAYDESVEKLLIFVEELIKQRPLPCKSECGLGKILVIGEAVFDMQKAKGFCKKLGRRKERTFQGEGHGTFPEMESGNCKKVSGS